MSERVVEHRDATRGFAVLGPRSIVTPAASTRAATASTSDTVRCRETEFPRSVEGAATPALSNSSDIIQRAPPTANSTCPTRPSSITIGS
ncbi:MAG TPA: hypothetical protein VIW24_11025 [Aldersonia sp.]